MYIPRNITQQTWILFTNFNSPDSLGFQTFTIETLQKNRWTVPSCAKQLNSTKNLTVSYITYYVHINYYSVQHETAVEVDFEFCVLVYFNIPSLLTSFWSHLVTRPALVFVL